MSQRSSIGIVLVLALLLVGLLLVIPMLGIIMWRPMMMGGGMMGGWNYPAGWGHTTPIGWGFMFAGMLLPILFIVLLIVGAYLLLTSRGGTSANETAFRILDERYARGEITEEQYLEMKEQLRKR